jgi:hypothetical protein
VKTKTRCSAMINGNSHFARKYQNGTIVTAEEGTIGILTFKTKRSAELWASFFSSVHWCFETPKLMIIKVETIGKGKTIDYVSTGITTEELEDYYSGLEDKNNQAPDNTIAYPAVLVLE